MVFCLAGDKIIMARNIEEAILEDENLDEWDLITPLKHLLDRYYFYIRPDGKLDKLISAQAWDNPWIHFNRSPINDCSVYHTVHFGCFNIFPEFCTSCWKVAIYPTDYEELMTLYKVLSEMGLPSKCGIDRRGFGRLYGGFIYSDSQGDAEKTHQAIKKILPDMESLVKCSCTEFTNKLGDPAKWEITDRQLRLEAMLREWLAVDNNVYYQPPYLKAYTIKQWREFAEKNKEK
jgi:hypothetical protein